MSFPSEFFKRQESLLIKHGKTVTHESSKSNGRTTYFIGTTFSALRDDIIADQWKNISSTFDLPDVAKELFVEAICGAGNEWSEINQFNSSTLLAFLCFYQVSKRYPITIRGIKYSEVHFEVQSPLKSEGQSKPVSNMDIVLISEDKKHALFLESKFTEYLSSKKPTVSSYYRKRYNDIFGQDLDFGSFRFADNKWTSNNSAYLEGVKQMICHYLGIHDSLINQQNLPKTAKYWKNGTLGSGMQFHLQEIIFDFNDGKVDAYKKLYAPLLPKLNNHAKQSKLNIVIENLTTYQDFFKENETVLNPLVKDFYGLPLTQFNQPNK